MKGVRCATCRGFGRIISADKVKGLNCPDCGGSGFASKPTVVSGRFDQGVWRVAQRRGRERGCWVYIAAEQLSVCGIDPYSPAPEYRVWAAGPRPRAMVNLREQQ